MFEYFLSKFYIAWVEISNKPIQWFAELCCYLAGGFILGFLFKQYARLFFILSFFLLLFLFSLNYFDAITINFNCLEVVKNYVNIDNGSYILDWMKGHIVQSVCAVLAFVVSWKFM